MSRPCRPWSALLGQLGVGLGVAAAHGRLVTGLGEALERVLAHGLEHLEAAGRPRSRGSGPSAWRAPSSACRPAHRLGRLERPAADEDAELREHRLHVRIEQVVAPADRRAQRLLALRGVARAGAEQVEPVRQALEDRRRAGAAWCARRRARSRAAARRGARRCARSAPGRRLASASRGFSARARLTNSSTAGARASGEIASSCSPATRSGERLVTTSFTRGDAASSRATSGAAPSTCSKLSSTSRTERPARCAASASNGALALDLDRAERLGDARARPAPARRSPPAARSARRPRSARRSRRASSSPSRVFPIPPGPVTVSRRTPGSASSATAASTSASRPSSGVGGTGSSGVAGSRGGGGGGAASRAPGSCARIAASSALELAARVEPELFDQRAADAPERLERVGLAARAVEREHQLRVHPLAVGMLGRQRLELADDRACAAGREVDVEALLQRGEPQAAEPAGLGRRRAQQRRVGERRPAEQPERLAQQPRRLREPAGRALLARALDQRLEALEVERARLELDRVARRRGSRSAARARAPAAAGTRGPAAPSRPSPADPRPTARRSGASRAPPPRDGRAAASPAARAAWPP